MGHRSECQSLWSIRSTSPSQIHHLPCSKKSLAPTGQRTATAKSRRSTKCTKLFWSQFWSYKWLLENTGMLFWYFLSSMSVVMFHENLRCLGQCSKTMQNTKFETWCGATALSIRMSPDEPEKQVVHGKTEKLRNRRGKFSTCQHVTKCHQFIPHIQFISNSITLRQSLIHNQDHSSSAFRDFLNHGPQALLKRCTAKMAKWPNWPYYFRKTSWDLWSASKSPR